MIEPSLFDAAPVQETQTGLTCAFGEAWLGPHPLCAAEVDRACAAFEAAVARGEYDEQGYTPTERKAQAKRRQTT